jgi:hypothetical protein
LRLPTVSYHSSLLNPQALVGISEIRRFARRQETAIRETEIGGFPANLPWTSDVRERDFRGAIPYSMSALAVML